MTSTEGGEVCEAYPGAICKAPHERSVIPKSVYHDAQREAEKHKWLESEKYGCDLGDQAIEDWYRNFWGKYCRTRRLEHLSGEQQWVEFAEHEFGRMYLKIRSGNEVLKELIALFEEGWENLDFMGWVHNEGKPPEEIENIIELLAIININIARLDPRYHAEQA